MADKKKINLEMVSNPDLLVTLLNSIDTEVDALRTLLNSIAASHAWVAEVDGDLDKINNYLSYLNEPNGVHSGSNYTLAEAAATTYTGAGQVYYRINGEDYFCDIDTTVAFTGVEVLTDSKYRAYRMEINKLGVVTLKGPGDIDSDTAENALLTLCSVPRTANTATLGFLTLQASGADFTPGTTNTDAGAHVNVFYYTKGFERRISGLTIAPSVALAIGTTKAHYSIGTLDYKALGQNVAQDVADVDCAFAVADTITGATKFGGHLIVTNLAQNLTVSIAADGIAETASNMTYGSYALAEAAVLACLKALPEVFAPVGYIITASHKATFTFNTDDLDDVADGTGTFVSFTVGIWDRLVDEAQTLAQHNLNAPEIPASVGTSTVLGTSVSEQTEQGK